MDTGFDIFLDLDDCVCDITKDNNYIIISDYYKDERKASISFHNHIGSCDIHIRIYNISHKQFIDLVVDKEYE